MTQTDDVAQLCQRRERLHQRCRFGKPRISHAAIAIAYGCDRTLVTHYFAGRRSPAGMGDMIRTLLAARNGKKG